MTQDKLAHLFAGGFIAAAVLPFGTVPAALAVVAAGVGRELIRPPFDVRDLAATIAGGVVMMGWLTGLCFQC